MKEVKISKNLVEAYNNFEAFMAKHYVMCTDEEDGSTYFAIADISRANEIRPEFERLCDTYHNLVEAEAEANGVAPSVIDDYFKSVCRRTKGLYNWKKFIKDYTFNVEGSIKY